MSNYHSTENSNNGSYGIMLDWINLSTALVSCMSVTHARSGSLMRVGVSPCRK